MRSPMDINDSYRINPQTQCWEWTRGTNGYGYAIIRTMHRTKYVHRIMYEKYKNDIPDNMQLDHLCRNRSCINPDHLEIVTQVENVRRGDNAKITMEIARKIREERRINNTTHIVLAQKYNISRRSINFILTDKHWKEI